MADQISTNKKTSQAVLGTLIMASNSIGYHGDVPLRSLEALRSADLLIFEEDKAARAALKAAAVTRDYYKYSEHQEKEAIEALRKCLKAGGQAVYMSRQGSPTLDDPGSSLLQVAYSLHAKVVVIPGPSSLTAALSACPFSIKCFHYLGLLPREHEERKRILKRWEKSTEALVIIDAPYRLKALLDSLQDVFQNNKKVFLAVDISGPDEGYHVGSIAAIKKVVDSFSEKLNFVIVVQ